MVAIKITYIASKEVDQSKRTLHKNLNTKRLDITDRNGNILATNLSSSSAYIHPAEIDDKDRFIENLGKIFGYFVAFVNVFVDLKFLVTFSNMFGIFS